MCVCVCVTENIDSIHPFQYACVGKMWNMKVKFQDNPELKTGNEAQFQMRRGKSHQSPELMSLFCKKYFCHKFVRKQL